MSELLLSCRPLDTGVHIATLYLWQIELIRRALWQGAAKCLGLYHLQQSNPADVLAAQVSLHTQLENPIPIANCQSPTVCATLGTGKHHERLQ